MDRKQAQAMMRKANNQLSANSLIYAVAGSSATPRTVANNRRFGRGAPRFAQKFVLPADLVNHFGDPARRTDSARIVFQGTNLEKIKASQVYAELHDRFCEGRPWESTGYIDRWKKIIGEAGPIDGMSRTEHILQRCNQLDTMWAQLNVEKALRVNRNALYWNGIRINVMAGNHFVHAREGTHRMVLAKLCGVRHIPVEVGFVDAVVAKSFQQLVASVELQAGADLSKYLSIRR